MGISGYIKNVIPLEESTTLLIFYGKLFYENRTFGFRLARHY
nr:MAG TPA: hypothetical protein [Caudoviricetes sp.]